VDVCFFTTVPLDAWQAHLTAAGVPIEEGPVPRTGAIGPLRSLYCRDPDGNLIEIAEWVG
jgi:catechol 2,3-dioxygenase-like lactoylglutathione lyase family enzyme